MRRKWIFIAPAALIGIVVFIFIGGEIVRLLWNWLLPPLFGWPVLTFWQAIAMLGLCRILFGGFGGRRGFRPGGGRGMPCRVSDRTVDRMAGLWDRMTPEERERFRQRVRERAGVDPSGS